MRKSIKSDLHSARYIVSTQFMLANIVISPSVVSVDVDNIFLYSLDLFLEC